MKKLKKAGEKIKHAKRKVAKTIRPNFWKQVILTMHPKTYSELSEKKISSSFKFLLSLIFASFIVMAIFSLPQLTSMNSYIESELSKFTELNITIHAETSEPVRIISETPQIIVDTNIDSPEMGSEKLLMTDEYILYKPYGKTRIINISDFKDVTTKKEEISKFIGFLFILLIPTIIIVAYILFLIKYIITILAFTILLFIGSRIFKKDLGIKKALNIAIYASVPMVFVEILFTPFNSGYLIPIFQFLGMNFYLITILAYVTLGIFGSYFAGKHVKKKKPEEEYPEVESGIQWE